MVSDRGPLDGATEFQPRVQWFSIKVEAAPASAPTRRVHTQLLDTTVLHDKIGPFTGKLPSAFDGQKDPLLDRRLDTEGVRVGPARTPVHLR